MHRSGLCGLGSKHYHGRQMHVAMRLMIPSWALTLLTRVLDNSKDRRGEDGAK